MNWKLFVVPPALLAVALAASTGCEVEVCDSDCVNSGGDGGEDASGGTTSGGGGTDAGGTGGTGGMGNGGMGGMAQELDCQADGSTEGSPSPVNDEATDECEICLWETCEEDFGACNATDPSAACRFGSTMYDGFAIEGEFDCMLTCLSDIPTEDADRGLFDVDDCAEQCGSSECGDEASPVAQDLSLCMLTGNIDGGTGCQDECGFDPL